MAGDATTHPLTGEVVWHAFYLHALLEDSHRRAVQVQLPHHGKQSERYQSALAARNVRMAGTGQPMWAHACSECEKMIPGENPGEPGSTMILLLMSFDIAHSTRRVCFRQLV